MKVSKPFLTKLETYIDEYVKANEEYWVNTEFRYQSEGEILYDFLRELKRYK